MASDSTHLLAGYHRAVDYIDREIVRFAPRRHSPEGKVRAALEFNRALGSPQRASPSIQIAGTSGKGTVAHFIASALSAAGLSTGLHVSPYLQAFTEKTWIDGRYLDAGSLIDAVEELRPVAESFRADDDCAASVHGMASLAASYLAFRRAGLDLTVVETGLGGRFDLVQGLDRELTVITELGLDHTSSLGATVDKIAWHKAGIIEADVPCVAVRGPGWGVLAREAREVGAPLHPIDFERLHLDGGRSRLDLDTLGTVELPLGDAAPFVVRNAVVAAHALDHLARAGRPIRPENLADGFRASFPGRFEIVQERAPGRPRVVLDCAHNPQKVAALCKALPEQGLTIVFAATGSRSPTGLLDRIAPLASRLIATQVDLYGKAIVPAGDIAAAGSAQGIETSAVERPEDALELALDSGADTVVVTGSVYLVGRLRDRWYPTDDVILQRTSWPALQHIDSAE